MIRYLPRIAVLLAAVLCFALGNADAAKAQRFRVLVSTDDRQLRSVVLEVTGYATSPSGQEEVLRQEALDDARRRALELARADLLGKIESRNLNLRLAFLGEPAVAPLSEMDANRAEPSQNDIARTAVFVHSAEKIDLAGTAGNAGDPYSLTVTAEVVYVLQPTDEDANRLRKPPPLPMAAPGQSPSRLKGEAGRRVREEAEDSMARQLLEALTGGNESDRTSGPALPGN